MPECLLRLVAKHDGRVCCAWGAYGPAQERARAVLRMMLDIVGAARVMALAFNADGSPHHPLRMAAALPTVWKDAATYARGSVL